MASISWTDSIGSAVLENEKPPGADRLKDWTPRDESIGPASFAPATGRLNGAKYRRDGLVSFSIPLLPGSALPNALRLKLHLTKGGLVELATTNELGERWAWATLAPETVPSIDFDAEMKEYIFGVTLRESTAPTVS